MQADAVEQLGLVGRHGLRQARNRLGFGVAGVMSHLRHGLQHGHALQHRSHLFQRGRGRQAIDAQRIGGFHHAAPIARGQRGNQTEHIGAVDAAQHLAHAGFEQLPAAKRNRLIGQRQRIAHGAARRARQQAQRLRLGRHVFRRQHLAQMVEHGFRRHGPQIELQAARQHRHRHLLRIGRGQHELQVFGRLFERLEHGVERRVRQHVHFVDHEDLEAPLHRLVDGLLEQALDLVDAAVRCRVELGVIREAAAVDFGAGRAHAAGRGGDAALAIDALAIERLGQNARHRGLADATRTREQIGVMQALLRQGIGQRLHDMLLPHHFGEIAGTVFAGKHEVGHAPDSTGADRDRSLAALFLPAPSGPKRQNARDGPSAALARPATPWEAGPGRATEPIPSLPWVCEAGPGQAWVYLPEPRSLCATIGGDGPPRMVKQPTGSGGEPSSPNCGVSAGGKARQLLFGMSADAEVPGAQPAMPPGARQKAHSDVGFFVAGRCLTPAEMRSQLCAAPARNRCTPSAVRTPLASDAVSR